MERRNFVARLDDFVGVVGRVRLDEIFARRLKVVFKFGDILAQSPNRIDFCFAGFDLLARLGEFGFVRRLNRAVRKRFDFVAQTADFGRKFFGQGGLFDGADTSQRLVESFRVAFVQTLEEMSADFDARFFEFGFEHAA